MKRRKIMKNNGLLLVISGPAGAGKGSVASELVKDENIRLSISATTRAPRGKEENGREYYFYERGQFEKMITENGFIEYAQYLENYYGTPKKPVDDWRKEGKDVILEIEVQGCGIVKKSVPDCISIFIMPPSMEILEKRLRGRGTETEENVQKRMKRAKEELALAENYDYVVVNDVLEDCVENVRAIITAEKLRTQRLSFNI